MIRRLFQFAIFLFFLNALYQCAPVGLRYFQFKDALQELALFSQKASEKDLGDRVMAIAAERGVPLDRDYVEVKRTTDELIISVAYVETMTIVPGSHYLREMDISVRAYNIEPAGR